MKKNWSYLKYVFKHKWFVLREGLKIGVNLWQLIIHDWSKFLPSEWFPYADYFYGEWATEHEANRAMIVAGVYLKTKADVSAAFDVAWLKHQNRQPHHWQFWMLTMDDGGTQNLPMPDRYRREMLADWRGAGLALGKPDTRGWYLANRDHIQLHPQTRAWIEEQLSI